MYDIAGIKDWITASIPTSDNEDEPEDGTGAKASKRTYTASDPDSCHPPKRRRRKDRQSNPASSKRSKIVNNMVGDTVVTNPDAEATPRAALSGRPSRSGPSAPSLDFGVPVDTVPMSPRVSVASSSSVSLVSSGGSKRSRRSVLSGPSKRAMLLAMPNSIQFRNFVASDLDKNALLGFKDLVDKIQAFAAGANTVPIELQDVLGASEFEFTLPHVYYTSSHCRSSLGAAPTLAEIDRIVTQARELRDDADSEAAYNSLVLGPLFALALSLSPHASRVAVKNITHATISPTSLVPLDANNESVGSRMVDWAVVLRPVGNLKSALKRARPQPDGGLLSLNHSRWLSLLNKPIAISIETKPEGEDLQQAYTQLAVWVTAHMNFLCQLLTGSASSVSADIATSTALPHLPLLVTQGSRWAFLFASRQTNGDTNIHSEIDFGNAITRHGVFKIISVLQLLIDWAEVQYRPWFEANAIVKE